ncbi:MAG: asparagine synthase (glutamine-hydrolyzing) [Bacteroidales bacterium]|nr:asparagine synthase (glutamine-hydrolyzing) [Bacteroidales bacterium]
MCGIAGGTRFNSDVSLNDDIMIKMLARIRHRGPDEWGIYNSENVSLGNVRLSIIDINTGQQPLSNSKSNIWIAYNGEVFNYIELRKELENKGYKFKTKSDTEVIVLMYEEYGIDFINRLNGQFAFSIWDKRTQELILVRDRLGIRPLFYTNNNGNIYFASEIKSLFEHPKINAKLSSQSLFQTFTFWTTISPNTAFENIFEIPAGHYMIFSKKKQEIKQYWDLNFPKKNLHSQLSFEEATDEFKVLLEDSVRIRLRADVPVAAYLSGGIDSTITTSLIRNIVPDLLQTFSIGFNDKDYDESKYQNLASEYFKTNHTGFKINNSEIADVFPEVIWHSEMPLLRTSPAPMFSLSKKVRENNIKVVITGEGADELLAGYNIFKETKIRHFWANQANSKYRPLLLKKLYPYIPQLQSANSSILKLFFGYKLSETNLPTYSHLLRWNNGNHIKKYFSQNIINETLNYNPAQELNDKLKDKFKDYDNLSKAQWLETKIFMSGYLLSSQGDRMAMANSVEGRYPFLDYRLVEFCTSLNPDFKLKGLDEKYLLKKAFENKIPKQIFQRPKQAYRAPIKNSFISENSNDYIKSVLNQNTIKNQGIFDSDKVRVLLEKLKSNKESSETEDMALTAILSTSLLYDLFINNEGYKKNIDTKNCKIINDFSK